MRDDGCLIWETRVSQFLHENWTSCRVRVVMAQAGQAQRRDQLKNFRGVDFEGEGEEGVNRVEEKYGGLDPWWACDGGLDVIIETLLNSNADLALPPQRISNYRFGPSSSQKRR